MNHFFSSPPTKKLDGSLTEKKSNSTPSPNAARNKKSGKELKIICAIRCVF